MEVGKVPKLSSLCATELNGSWWHIGTPSLFVLCLPYSKTLNPWHQSTFPGGSHSLHGETGQQQSHLTPEPAPPKGQGGKTHFDLLQTTLSSVLLEALTQTQLLLRLCLMWGVRWCSSRTASTAVWPTQKLKDQDRLSAVLNNPPEGCGSSQVQQGQSFWWTILRLCAVSWEQASSCE